MAHQIGDWSKRALQWLGGGAVILGPALSLLVVPAAFVVLLDDREMQVRYAGLVFELLGLWLVVHGIRQTRSLFKKPSLRQFATQWLKSWPRWRVPGHAVGGIGNATVGSFGASLLGTSEISASATIEQKVEALRLQLQLLGREFAAVRTDHDQRLTAQNDALQSEKRARAEEDEAIRRLIDESIAGGLHLETIGVVWLFFGIVLSTVSSELAKYLPW